MDVKKERTDDVKGGGNRGAVAVKSEGHAGERTVSPVTILQGVQCIGADPALNHLFVHVYVPYARCALDVNPFPFIVQSIPCYEGWYSAWLELLNVVEVPGLCGPVLRCVLHWHDGTAQHTYVTRGGELVMHTYPDNPVRGVPLDGVLVSKAGKQKSRATVDISHTLTLEEIESGIRGVVHGSVMSKNNGRKVSHITSIQQDESVLCSLLPKTDKSVSARETVRISSSRVRKFVPELLHEFNHRVEQRFTVREASFILKFVNALFLRANENDFSVREAIRLALRTPSLAAVSHSSTDQSQNKKSHAEGLTLLEQLLGEFEGALNNRGRQRSNQSTRALTSNGTVDVVFRRR